jgi:hypothetical protein
LDRHQCVPDARWILSGGFALIRLFLAKFRAAGAAILPPTIGANVAVAKFDRAELAADIARDSFVNAIGGGLFYGFFRHEI